jgi:capsular exopolysaccharide synthesis family protein
LWKYRYLAVAVAAATAICVALWTLKQPKIYAAEATIEFDPNPPRPLGQAVQGVTDDASNYWLTREYYTTQFRVIQSQRVAEAVVRQLGLQHDADFLGVPASARRKFRSLSVTDAAKVLRARMKVEPVRDSRLVSVSVEDTDPRRARLLSNTVVSVYVRQNLEKKLSTTVSTLEWLGQQLESLRTQLEQSERSLYDYRRQNNLLSVSYEDRRNHVSNRIVKLSDSLTEMQTRRIGIAARVTELRRAAAAEDPLVQRAPELLSSPLLQDLRRHFEELRRERDGLATRYGPQAQQMTAVEGRLTELRDAIRTEVQNILGAAEAELRSVQRSERDLHVALQEAQNEALELNLREIEYGRLQRDRENNAKLYSIVLERTKETDLTRMLRVNNVLVLDEAQLPGSPIKPKVMTNIVLGVLGGIFLGIAAAFLAVQADRSVRSQGDVEEELQSTFLGIFPRVHARAGFGGYRYQYGEAHGNDAPVTNSDLVVHTHPTSVIAEACRVIRTNLLFMSPDKPFQVLMVASADPREGKTTVAINLALTLAQSGKRVLLIDTDLRRPRVHKAFNIRPAVGMTNVLVNEVSLEDAIIETEVPNVSLLPCGPIPPNPSELLHSQRFQEVLAQARGRFDRIVFDTPPVGAVTDALIIGPQVDGAILVVRTRKTARTRAARVLAQLRALGTRIAGVVLNDVDLRKEGDASYYYGGYQYASSRSKEAA